MSDRPPIWARFSEAMRMMKVSPTTLKRWIKDERVRSQKIEGCRFVDVSEYVHPSSADTVPDLTPLLKRIANLKITGKYAHKHAEKIEAYLAQRGREKEEGA